MKNGHLSAKIWVEKKFAKWILVQNLRGGVCQIFLFFEGTPPATFEFESWI